MAGPNLISEEPTCIYVQPHNQYNAFEAVVEPQYQNRYEQQILASAPFQPTTEVVVHPAEETRKFVSMKTQPQQLQLFQHSKNIDSLHGASGETDFIYLQPFNQYQYDVYQIVPEPQQQQVLIDASFQPAAEATTWHVEEIRNLAEAKTESHPLQVIPKVECMDIPNEFYQESPLGYLQHLNPTKLSGTKAERDIHVTPAGKFFKPVQTSNIKQCML